MIEYKIVWYMDKIKIRVAIQYNGRGVILFL